MPAVRNFCQRAIWLDNGTVVQSGEASQVCAAYQERINQDVRRQNQARGNPPTAPQEDGSAPRPGRNKIITIAKTEVETEHLHVGASLALRFLLRFSELQPAPAEFGLGVQIHNEQGRLVAIFNTIRDNVFLSGETQDISLCLPSIGFIPGRYWVSANVCDREAMFAYDEFEQCSSFEVLQEFNRKGIPRWEGEVACAHTWRW